MKRIVCLLVTTLLICSLFLFGALAAEYSLEITEITFEDAINADLKTKTLTCFVSCNEIPADTDTFVAKLYDKTTQQPIEENSDTLATFGAVIFDSIPNKDATYELKIYIADETGTPISETVVREYSVLKATTLSGYIKSTEIVKDFFIYSVKITMLDCYGKETVYQFVSFPRINNIRYTNDDSEANVTELTNALPQGAVCQFLLNSYGWISYLAYDTTPTTYRNVFWDSSEAGFSGVSDTTGLPVFYCTANGNLVDSTPFLSSDCIYLIEVYDYYAVVLKDFSSYQYPYTIKEIQLTDRMMFDLTAKALICEISLNNTPTDTDIFVAKLYDKTTQQLIEEKRNISAVSKEIMFGNLPNQRADYVIELYVADKNGTPLSNTISTTCSVCFSQTHLGTVSEVFIKDGLWNYTVSATDGTSYTVSHTDIWVDGTHYAESKEVDIRIGDSLHFTLNAEGNIYIISRKNVFSCYARFTGSGSVSLSAGTVVLKNTEQIVTATPAVGWMVGNVRINGVESAALESFSVTIVDHTEIEIAFVEIPQNDPIATIRQPFIPEGKASSITFGMVTPVANTAIKEYGIVYSMTDSTDPQIGEEGCFKLPAKTPLSINGHYGIRLMGDLLKNTTYYTRSYLIYTDASNMENIAYGTVIKVNLGADKTDFPAKNTSPMVVSSVGIKNDSTGNAADFLRGYVDGVLTDVTIHHDAKFKNIADETISYYPEKGDIVQYNADDKNETYAVRVLATGKDLLTKNNEVLAGDVNNQDDGLFAYIGSVDQIRGKVIYFRNLQDVSNPEGIIAVSLPGTNIPYGATIETDRAFETIRSVSGDTYYEDINTNYKDKLLVILYDSTTVLTTIVTDGSY